MHHFVISQQKHKCKAKPKGAHLRKSNYPLYRGGMVRCSFLDTLAIASMYIFSYIFSSNVSHSQGNQRNSIIKQWKKIELLLFFLLSKNNKKPDGLCMGSSSNLNTKRSEVPQSNISTYPCSDVPSFSKVFEIC